MLVLAWANLTHHKLRTLLSALAVGIGIMLLLVSRGLASGSLAEVNERMQSVDAELVILPAQDNIIFTNGAPFRASHERIDAVVLDMVMPGLSGGETFDRLHEIDPGVRVMLSSGYSIDSQAREIMEKGCNGFLQKPFLLERLSVKIREVLS